MYLAETERIGLVPYTHEDDPDMYLCWKDEETQRGFNYLFDQPLEALTKVEIGRFRFWVTVVDKGMGERVGVLRLGLDEQRPDLAIWIYPRYRRKGYGTEAFRLSLGYLFDHYPYREISAGCYCDNVGSLKMLARLGFERFLPDDVTEPDCFSGQETTQLGFVLSRAAFVR